MSNEYRPVAGLYKKYWTNEPLANATINIRLMTNSFTLEAGYPTSKNPNNANDPGQSFQTDENGNLPEGLELFCSGLNVGGVAKYRVTEPDGFTWDFILDYGDGTPISMQTLRAGGLPASNPETVIALIENKINASSLRYDIAQILTPEQQQQVLDNLGITAGGGGGGASISNTAYGAGWDGDISNGASKNAIYDAMESLRSSKQNSLGFTPEDAANKNITGGYAGLDSNGYINPGAIPPLRSHEFVVVANQTVRLALTTSQMQIGDEAFQTDSGETYKLISSNPALTGSWQVVADTTPDWSAIQNKPTFATVATSGSYNDLSNKPTLFSGSYADLTNQPTLSSFLPSQTGNSGKALVTNGTSASWQTVSGGGGGASSPLTLTANNATEKPLILNGASGQSVNLFEVNTFGNTGGNIARAQSDGFYIPAILTGYIQNISPNGLSLNSYNTAFRLNAFNGLPIEFQANGTTHSQFDANTTAGETRLMLWDCTAGTMKRVKLGTLTDSGASGHKVLMLAN